MASQPPTGDQKPCTKPAPPSVPAAKSCSYEQKCFVLVDWWLEKMDGKICIAGQTERPQPRKGAYSSQGKRRLAGRMFKRAIVKRWDSDTVETENGYMVWIKGMLNNSRMRENGFSDKVCESFMGGFPIRWNELADSKMDHIDEHSPSPSPSNSADDALEEIYLKLFMGDSFVSSEGCSFVGNDFSSFRNLTSPDMGEPGTPKCRRTSANMGTENVSEVPAAGMSPLSGTVHASEKNEGRTLRSGKILGGQINAAMTGGKKRKREHKPSNNKKLPNEAVSPAAALTSHQNQQQQDPSTLSTPSPGPNLGALPLLSPTFSRRTFPAATSATVVSEPPSVTLDEWWLATVEEHEGKIAVAGFFERNQAVWQFTAALIAKRHEPCILETEDGIVVFIFGHLNRERTIQNGFTDEACENFSLGFPHWWEEWNVCCPNMMSSQTGSQPRSSRTSNLCEDPNVPSASTLESTMDEHLVEIDNASHIKKGRQKTAVNSMRRRTLHDKAVSGEAMNVSSPEKGKQLVGSVRKQKSAIGKLQHATRSPNIKSKIPYGNLPLLTRDKAKSLAISTPEYLKLKKTRSGRVVVPALVSGCQNIVYAADGSISAIVGLDTPPLVKGSTSKVKARKNK